MRQPDFVIGDPAAPYLRRWWLIPRNRFFNIYLHQILRDDDDRALHDHPWWNVSVILKGGYYEHTPAGVFWRRPGQFVFRRASARHRLELDKTRFWEINVGAGLGPTFELENPCWSLFITGPKVREWGFWCKKGFVHWRDFVNPNNAGEVGPGCGE